MITLVLWGEGKIELCTVIWNNSDCLGAIADENHVARLPSRGREVNNHIAWPV